MSKDISVLSAHLKFALPRFSMGENCYVNKSVQGNDSAGLEHDSHSKSDGRKWAVNLPLRQGPVALRNTRFSSF